MRTTQRPRELVLVRHGETEWSRSGKHTSRTDVPLTEHGVEQAQRLGTYFDGRRFGRVLTSPMSRARETCRGAGLGDVAEVTDDLREFDYGVYEGRTTADIRTEEPGWTVWTHPLFEGETLAEVSARADRLTAAAQEVDDDVVFFGHAHILRIVAVRWCGLPAVDGRLLALDAATLSVLGFERETRVIRRWNEAIDVGAVGSREGR
jgi:broad specificity phosphatase PhoE